MSADIEDFKEAIYEAAPPLLRRHPLFVAPNHYRVTEAVQPYLIEFGGREYPCIVELQEFL